MSDFDKLFKKLLGEVGRPYEMYNNDGTYQGCFYPVQFLFPGKPRYKMPSKDPEKNYLYGIKRIKQHCTKIKREELQKGDIIACRFRDELHVAVYYEFDKIIHVFRGHTLQLDRLKILRDFECYRVV